MKTLHLRKGKTESLRRFHPWIFSGALQYLPEDLQEGEVVRVESHDGEFLAVGHYQIGSIAVRVLSFVDEAIDEAFWHERLGEAYQLRKTLQLQGTEVRPTNICRLVHGEGDRLPGLVVDRYGDTAVMQAHSVGMHLARHQIARALVDVSGGELRNVYYKSETTLPYKADLTEKEGYLVENSSQKDESFSAYENGLRFRIDWLHGQKTGFFVDQRENRALLEHYSRGRRVLNMFCYTGGFSVYALRGGAEKVVSVDASEKAIALTHENVSLNFPTDARHEAYAEDAFHFLARAGKDFDLVVLDPPAFAKHHSAVRNAIKGYTRLNQEALSRIPSGGLLFTFSCSQAITKEQFRLAVFTAAANARRRVRILHQLHQPADHPIDIYHPEGEYLKGLVLEVE